MARFAVLRVREIVPHGGLARRGEPAPPTKIDVEEIEANPGEVPDLLSERDVEVVAPDMPMQLIKPVSKGVSAPPADPAWGIKAIRADVSAFTGKGVKVAVLDTGIDQAHPAFEGVRFTDRDFTGEGPGDGHGHGTHCAGTFFGRNLRGVPNLGDVRIGVARGVTEVLDGKVLRRNGAGSSVEIFKALQWAMTEGARVISISVSINLATATQEAVKTRRLPTKIAAANMLQAFRENLRLYDSLMAAGRDQEGVVSQGSVVVAAAGNESLRDEDSDWVVDATIPAASRGVLSVGAVVPDKDLFNIASFSNINPEVCAPGVGVLSAWPKKRTRVLQGTSQACPHVAGVAALYWEAATRLKIPLRASEIAAEVRSTSRRDVFTANVTPEDRGRGLVTAP